MKWNLVAYNKMSTDQQQMVQDHLLTKQLTVADLPRWKFLVRDDGVVIKRKGLHQPTPEYAKELDDMLKGDAPSPSKDQPVVFGSGTRFTFVRD